MYPIPRHQATFYITMYFYKGLWNYKADIEGEFSLWTENKNHGDAATEGLHGKRFFFFTQPQFWYNFNSGFSLGSKVNTYYHVNNTRNAPEVYPTAAIRYKFK